MARTKTVSQNIAIFASDNATGTQGTINSQLFGVTSCDWTWNQNKQPVFTYGSANTRKRIAVEPPEVTLNLSYYLAGGANEDVFGLLVDGTQQSTLKRLLDKTRDEQNYYILVAPEGADAEGLSGTSTGVKVVGIGNGFLNSYSLEAAIGDFPTVSVGVQGLNVRTYTGGSNQASPGVNPSNGVEITGMPFTLGTVSTPGSVATDEGNFVLTPGAISVNLASAGGVFYDYSSTDVQSFRVSFDLNRQPLNKLGSRYSTSREISFPVDVNFEVTMLAKDLQTGSLADILCDTGLYNASVSFRRAVCGTGTGSEAFGLQLKNISLESQSTSTPNGSDPQTITTTWLGQVGGTGDLTNGLFMSGASII